MNINLELKFKLFEYIQKEPITTHMSNDPKLIRRPTKRPAASKSVHIDQEYSNIAGCSFSNNSSQLISPENCTLSTIKAKFENDNISKNQALQYLQCRLSILQLYRQKISNILTQIEREHLSSRPEQISKAKIIDYNLPLKIKSGYHHPAESPNGRPTVTISPNAIHASSSSANLLNISRSHSIPIASSASTASISLLSQRQPSSPGSSRDKTRSPSVDSNLFSSQTGNDQLSEAININNSNNGANPSYSKSDEANNLLGNQDSFFRNYSDPLGGLNSVSFSSSSATISTPQAASIPRSMSASHFSRNSNSAQDGKGEKGPSSSTSNNSSSSSTKSMTALTIWNNVNKFFVTVPTVDQFQQRLQASEPPDTKLPLGPHYSIGINQKLKQKYKNGNVQLRIPPEIIAESPEGVTSIIFHRLLASFVTLDADDLLSIKKNKVQYQENSNENEMGDESNSIKGLCLRSSSDISNEFDQQISLSRLPSNLNENSGDQQKIIDTTSLSYSKQGSNSSIKNWNYISDYSNMEQFPVNIAGTSVYSMCPFEQKLVLEVQSLNLIPEPSGLKMTDNEVMNDIIQKTKESKQIKDENNKMKLEFLEKLKSKEKELLERKEKSKKWGSVSFKVEQGQKKDLKRPKKRDKLI